MVVKEVLLALIDLVEALVRLAEAALLFWLAYSEFKRRERERQREREQEGKCGDKDEEPPD